METVSARQLSRRLVDLEFLKADAALRVLLYTIFITTTH
jgi:hypothetical protein